MLYGMMLLSVNSPAVSQNLCWSYTLCTHYYRLWLLDLHVGFVTVFGTRLILHHSQLNSCSVFILIEQVQKRKNSKG